MKTYTAFSKDFDWMEFGSLSKCCALAQDYCRQNFETVAYVGQLRGGEPRGRLIFEVTAGKYTRILAPQFFQAKHIKLAHSALRRCRYE